MRSVLPGGHQAEAAAGFAGYSGNDVRDVMLEAVEKRFRQALPLASGVQATEHNINLTGPRCPV
jgi:hypothetical protein